MTKRVGPIIPNSQCGFSATYGTDICGAPPTAHGLILDTFEDYSFGMACDLHAEVLRRVADETHPAETPCFGLASRWLTRPDGSSFCYHPDSEAELHAELAGAITRPLVPA